MGAGHVPPSSNVKKGFAGYALFELPRVHLQINA